MRGAAKPDPRPVSGTDSTQLKVGFLRPTNLFALAGLWNPAGMVVRLTAILPLPEEEGRGEGEASKRTD